MGVTIGGLPGSEAFPMRWLPPRVAGLALLLVVAPASAEIQLGCPDAIAREVVELVNLERAAAGRPPLEIDVRLMESAQLHSEDMAAGNFVSHTGSGGSTFVQRIEAAGYTPWWRLAENVAGGQPTPAAVVAAWMGSSGHRANILNPDLEDIGVGYAYDAATTYRHHWTQNFGWTPTPEEPPLGFCPACSDAVDNDGDGWVDHPDDPQCTTPERNSERPPRRRCGLGAEIGLLPPALWALRRRRAGRGRRLDAREG